ncbi:rhodanese-like domain-containing protein [Alkalihalobacterium alkalinitrilicum]|uniref:rhodanese-like domain-containing protein n=1 Tax=Alkalihalobacterium alkalinitrilicum TaxID=427920 RepID=UPI00114FE1B2|nr:rhodanese-like domain-containing protein [Alkalihalobacterium alkalinitrilicum]
MAIILFILFFIMILLYRRFVPVRGVKCTNLIHINEDIKILDIRDYNIASHQPITRAINIPFAYIKRYYHPFKGKKVVVISNDVVAKNLCIRFLKQKGVTVTGYYLCRPSSEESRNMLKGVDTIGYHKMDNCNRPYDFNDSKLFTRKRS